MGFAAYMRDRWKTGVLLLSGLVTVEIFLFLYSVTIWFHFYILFVLTAAFLLGNYLEYRSKKSFYQDVFGKLMRLNEKYLIVEMLPATDTWEEKLLKEILAESNKSMLENVNTYKAVHEEYKDYIELWIHEVKLPIATSKMMIENNRNDVTEKIEEEINEIEDYTEQALFYARSSHANKDYLVKECRIGDIVNETIRRNKQTLINQKIKITVEDTDYVVYTDQKWCHFILNQIIGNSIKYKKEKNAEICFAAEAGKDSIILSVQDNGIGIKQAEVTRVFEKGFTGSNGRIGKKSTGIGLYLCKKLCDKLGLGIQLTSQENAGTTVKLIFPKNSYSDLR